MKHVDPFLYEVTALLDDVINSIEMGGNRTELWKKLKTFREKHGPKMSEILENKESD